jgi:hypothetical protein
MEQSHARAAKITSAVQEISCILLNSRKRNGQIKQNKYFWQFELPHKITKLILSYKMSRRVIW